jgi:hypothetical protein
VFHSNILKKKILLFCEISGSESSDYENTILWNAEPRSLGEKPADYCKHFP